VVDVHNRTPTQKLKMLGSMVSDDETVQACPSPLAARSAFMAAVGGAEQYDVIASVEPFRPYGAVDAADRLFDHPRPGEGQPGLAGWTKTRPQNHWPH
jgi:hypothetical protein